MPVSLDTLQFHFSHKGTKTQSLRVEQRSRPAGKPDPEFYYGL